MARQRLVKPELFTHVELYAAEKACGLPLRLVFVGLWTVADRRGVFRWRENLKLAILPYDPTDVMVALDHLEAAGFVRSYESGGKKYGWIPTFQQHQTFHRHERASADPGPPDAWLNGIELSHGEPGRPWISRTIREEVMARDGGCCVLCGSSERVELDHVIPYASDGPTTVDNLQVLCRKCNGRKGNGAGATPPVPRGDSVATEELALQNGRLSGTVVSTGTGAVAGTVTSAVAVSTRQRVTTRVAHGTDTANRQINYNPPTPDPDPADLVQPAAVAAMVGELARQLKPQRPPDAPPTPAP